MHYKFAPTTKHNLSYYRSCLLILVAGLTSNLSHAEIAHSLNDASLKSPQGLDWTASIVKQTYKKLRLNEDYRSSFYKPLMRLVFDGEMTATQVRPLFAQRLTGVL